MFYEKYQKKDSGIAGNGVTLSSVPVLPVSAEDSEIALRIARVELSPEQVATLSPYGGFEERIQRTREEILGIQAEINNGQLSDEEREKRENDIRQKESAISGWEEEMQAPENQRVVAVNMQISGNGSGFLASEFGIDYDNRLDLRDIQNGNIGDAFQYTYNEEEHIIWFSGASSMGSEVASRDKDIVMTLYFQIPENYTANDQYNIAFTWNTDQRTAFWYDDSQTNVVDSLKANSHNGLIWLPSAESPRLSSSQLEMNQNSSCQLEALNLAGGCYWFSNNASVATVTQEGFVESHTPGVATIYCIASSGQTLTCDVTVTKYYYYTLKPNDSEPIQVTSKSQVIYVDYPNAPTEEVLWQSPNPDIVTVDDKTGRIRPVSDGVSMIIGMYQGMALIKPVVINMDGGNPPTPTETDPPEPPPTDPPETDPPETDPPETDPPETDPPETDPPETDPPISVTMGDVNGDNEVTILDVLYLNQALVGLIHLNDAQLVASDTYADGLVNDKDAITILKYLVDLVHFIPMIPE